MRLLLDTHIVLWQLAGARELPERVRAAIADAEDLLISVASFAEIGIKVAVGKLDVPDDLVQRVDAAGVRTLGLTPTHGLAVADLPVRHRDPFDRLIIAQAQVERLTVVTADERFLEYDVSLLRA
jgi:PIN domain nuclease of toxin-antitoxin system